MTYLVCGRLHAQACSRYSAAAGLHGVVHQRACLPGRPGPRCARVLPRLQALQPCLPNAAQCVSRAILCSGHDLCSAQVRATAKYASRCTQIAEAEHLPRPSKGLSGIVMKQALTLYMSLSLCSVAHLPAGALRGKGLLQAAELSLLGAVAYDQARILRCHLTQRLAPTPPRCQHLLQQRPRHLMLQHVRKGQDGCAPMLGARPSQAAVTHSAYAESESSREKEAVLITSFRAA